MTDLLIHLNNTEASFFVSLVSFVTQNNGKKIEVKIERKRHHNNNGNFFKTEDYLMC
jgi:hypothetical protein